MATTALKRPMPRSRSSSSASQPLDHDAESTPSPPSSPAQCPSPVPNKHIPNCPTGPAPPQGPNTPPPSPGTEERALQTSTLYPADVFHRLRSGSLSIFELDAYQVAEALDFSARQPLPDPSLVFPWLHGLHAENQVQQNFFAARRRAHRKTPSCLRSITVVKADGDLSRARLKGAIAPDEILLHTDPVGFIEADPREGFSVRNFQIQAVKVAITSDIIVYGDDFDDVQRTAWDIAGAQQRYAEKHYSEDLELEMPRFNTFVCTSEFAEFEQNHRDIVAVDASGTPTGNVLDFFLQERREMWDMASISEISHNVFLGPSPDTGSLEEQQYDILIDCSDLGRLNPFTLQVIAESPVDDTRQRFLDFPASGSILPPTWSHSEADGILDTCKWIYHLAHGTYPESDRQEADTDNEGDSPMTVENHHPRFEVRPHKILIHCGDGYTESTMLGLAYYSYSTGQPIHKAWLDLHVRKKRNFFAYSTDVALLTAIAPRLLRESPVCADMSLTEITTMIQDEPPWFAGIDGSFPSRVLDYMYLGNINHANNAELLKALGITQLLSVGEIAIWPDGELEEWGEENVCLVQNVQDNGIDPLTDEFTRCLEFIERGRRKGTATLVHCRVGVSRSATICIAEVMRALKMSLPQAYCYVRARRLNVIIQPHLRFAYELLKWEETLQRAGNPDASMKRTFEWGELSREIAAMNLPYSR